jgi:hypothetical protein
LYNVNRCWPTISILILKEEIKSPPLWDVPIQGVWHNILRTTAATTPPESKMESPAKKGALTMETNFRNVTIYGQYINADTDLPAELRTMKEYFWTVFKRFV